MDMLVAHRVEMLRERAGGQLQPVRLVPRIKTREMSELLQGQRAGSRCRQKGAKIPFEILPEGVGFTHPPQEKLSLGNLLVDGVKAGAHNDRGRPSASPLLPAAADRVSEKVAPRYRWMRHRGG